MNRPDLMEVFKIRKRFNRMRPNNLFYFDDTEKDTRGHSVKLVKVDARGTVKIFILK